MGAVRTSPVDLRILPLFRQSWLGWLLLGLIFAVGLGLRLYDLSDPPLDFHPTRQVHSALIARGMYYEGQADDAAGRRELALALWQTEGQIEPPIFERLTAWTYGLVSQPDLRIPRLYAIFFWMVGAVFLTWLAIDMCGWGGGWVAALFFLVWPYGVVGSRAFQPEPLMIALMVMALWAAMHWERRGTWNWAIAAGLLSGLAILVKSVAVFFIGPALLVLALSGKPMRALRLPQVWVLAALTILPYAIYHIDGVYLRGYLASQFSLRFFPEMWIDPAFYLRWISNLGRAVPFEMLLVALLGLLLVRRPLYRVMLLAMWLGYGLYGMALPHHISTHDYYHLPLFPLVALGLAAVAETLFQNLRGPRWLVQGFSALALLAALVITGYTARNQLKRFDAAAQAQAYEAVGQALGPGASVAALTSDYGSGLKYWGWVNPAVWQTSADIQWRESLGEDFDFQAFFEKEANSRDFFVVTDFEEFARQPALKELLETRYSVFQQGPGYLIYDLRPGTP